MVARQSPVSLVLLILAVLLVGAIAAPRTSQAMGAPPVVGQPLAAPGSDDGAPSPLLDPVEGRGSSATDGFEVGADTAPPLWALALLFAGVVLLARPRAVRSRV